MSGELEVKKEEGIEDLKKAMELAGKNIALGIKIGKDGLSKDDIQFAPEVFNSVKELVEFISAKPELMKEIKDLDPMEGFELLKKGYDIYKEIAKE
jgi:hypothetical protein